MTIDTARYRQIIGHFASGVTVITSAHDGWLHGMTANAVTSVSLNPLLLLVCVDHTAHAHQQLEESGRFGVNILTEDQEDVSRLFASHEPPERDSLRGVAYHLGQHGAPIIEGCLAYFECEVAERFAGGDHTIFLGAVQGGEVLQETLPLLFYRGGYRRLGA
jgi:flavin reductase (DIM6/NTAB) family NADH-FMN oxidoreductase RutF